MSKKTLHLLGLTLIFTSLFNVLFPQTSEAITVNSANIPSIYRADLDTYKRRCQETASSPVHLHGQVGWISRDGQPTNISPVTVDEGTSSINLQWNVLSRHCTENMSPNNMSGNIANQAIQVSRYNIVSASSNVGSVSGFRSYLDTDYRNTYGSPNLYYVKESSNVNAMPVHDGFTLSGIGGLAPGTHTITVTLRTRVINSYSSGFHACVGGGGPAGNLSDSRCNAVDAPYSFQLTVNQTRPDITLFTNTSCNTLQVRADTTTGANWDVRVLRNGANTTVLRQNIADNDTVDLDISGLQSGGGADYQVRVRDTSNTESRTSGTIYVARCPTIDDFSISCDGGISLTVTTDTGSGWAARLFVDGVSTAPGGAGRMPNSGTNSSGSTDTESITRWHDTRSHRFQLRIDDSSDPSKLQTWTSEEVVGPCVTTSCDISDYSTTPANPEPNTPFDMQFRLGLNGTIGSAYASSFNFTVAYNAPGFNPQTGSQSASGSQRSVTFNNITVPAAGSYEGTFTVSGDVSLTCTFGEDPDDDFPETIVYSRPYLRVYGGDVIAGVGFVENDCTPNNNSAQILTFNQGMPNYAGSATDLAVFALGRIEQFASYGGGGSNAPRHLSFANTSTDSSDEYGTNSQLRHCVPDYWAGANNVQSSLNLTDRTVGVGTEEAFYVEGDATITGNIIYTDTGWTSFEDIPGFSLIVKGGNIYIDKEVTQLSGTYVAIPDSAGTGIIYTCADGSNAYIAPIPNGTGSAGCGNKLTIHGAFVAEQVKFLRTSGTTGVAPDNEAPDSTNIAEVFIFGPEMWLGR